MSKILTDNQYYSQIANIIREQNGTSNTYTPPQMVSALKDLFYEEVEGVPPISFNGIGENLLDYRIDGASGGVGDRTKNLFNEITYQGGINNVGNITDSTTRIRSEYIDVDENETYTCSSNLKIRLIYAYNNEYNKVECIYDVVQGKKVATFVIPIGATKIRITFMDVDNPNNEITPNDFLWGQLEKGSIATDYEPYGYKVPVVISGKNLFNENSEWNLRGSLTSGDYKFPGNLEGNRRTFFYKVKPNTTYTVSVDTPGDRLGIIELSRNINPINASIDQKITPDRVILTTSVEPENVYPYTFTTSSTAKIVGVYYSLNTMPINMQIEIGDTATDYEEYQELDTVDIYLDSPIEKNESISLSDTNTNIPTIRGTNVLSVDTTVQPSNVYIKARKESSYEIAMRERYEEAQAQLDALESGGE